MALNPSIILAGQTPDIMGSLSRGMATGQQQNQIGRENALANLYQTQGAGIAAGDPGALNALAGIDPMAAMGAQSNMLGMDQQRLGMDQTRQSMGLQAEQAKRAAAEYARGLSADQAAAEAAQIENAVKAGMMAQTPQEFDAMMAQLGVTDMVGKFGQRDMLATQFMSVAEVLKQRAGGDPKFRQASPEEAAGYGASGGQFGPDGRFYAIEPPSNGITQTVTNPDGSTSTIQIGGKGGAAGTTKPLTESQAKFTVFQTDMEQAAQVITQLEQTYDPTNLRDATAGILGKKWGSFLQTPDGQIYTSAALQWLDSGLRIRTGAAATDDEVMRNFAAMFPQPGDKPETVAYKRRARENFQRSVDAALKGVRDPQAPAAPADPLMPSVAPPPAPAAPVVPQPGPQPPPRADAPSGNAGGIGWKVIQ